MTKLISGFQNRLKLHACHHIYCQLCSTKILTKPQQQMFLTKTWDCALRELVRVMSLVLGQLGTMSKNGSGSDSTWVG